jgi:hypothetical protein
MEFEKNTAPTAEDIALADAPKVTVQPLHAEIPIDPVTYHYQQEKTFTFESEKTDGTKWRSKFGQHQHHFAAVTSIGIVVVFAASLSILYLSR